MAQYNLDKIKNQRSKMKDAMQRGISLILALIMLFPTGAFAGSGDEVWHNTYKQALMTQIMNQNEEFVIEYKGKSNVGDYFSIEADELFRQLVDENKIPAIYGPVNIKSKALVAVRDNNGVLKSIKHIVKYHNTKADFDKVSNELDGVFKDIVLRVETPYERIKAVYKYLYEYFEKGEAAKHNKIGFNENGKIKKKPVSQGVYAILFSIMMDKMGYDNRIAVGVNEGKVDNKVMFQGEFRTINVVEETFLKEIEIEEIEEDPTKNQLQYEIEYLVRQIKASGGLLSRLIAVAEEFEVEVSAKKLSEIKTKFAELGIEKQKYETKKQIIVEKAEMVDIDLDYSELDKVINSLNSTMKGIENRIATKDAIEKAKASGMLDDLKKARDLVEGISKKIVKDVFIAELAKIQESIDEKNVEKIIEKAEELVDQAEIKVIVPGFNSDTEYDPKYYPTAVLYINAAKTQISKIKAIEYQINKLELDARLKDIEAVQKAKEAFAIAQVKKTAADVKKAEGLILAISTVRKSEPKDGEIEIIEYKGIREDLLKELKKLEVEVTTTIDEANAIKAVELTEKTLKKGDYDKAIAALDKIDTTDVEAGKELRDRLGNTYDVILAIEEVENAEKVMREKAVLSTKILGALDEAVKKLNSLYEETEPAKIHDNYIRYSPTIKSLKTRIKTVSTVKDAIADVETVEGNLKNVDIVTKKVIKENVNTIRTNVDIKISDSKIKKELNTRLDNILSDLDAVEKVERAEDIQANHIAGNLVNAIKDAEAAIKKVKTESIKSDLDNRIKIVKAKDLISKVDEAIKNAETAVENAEENSNKDNISAAKKAVADAKKAIVAAENAIRLAPDDEKRDLTADLEKKKVEENGIYKIDKLEKEIKDIEQKIKDDAEELKVLQKAEQAIQKAKDTFPKTETTIKAAITAVKALKNRQLPNDKLDKLHDLEKEIEDLFKLMLDNAENKVDNAIESLENNYSSLKKDVSDAQKAVTSVENLAELADRAGLKTYDEDSEEDKNYYTDPDPKYAGDIGKLKNIVNAINASMDAIKLIETAEKLVFDKYTTTNNATASFKKAEKAVTNIKDDSIKDDIGKIIDKLESRLVLIDAEIKKETTKEGEAITAVLAAETTDEDDLDGVIRRGKINEARNIIKDLLDTNLQKTLEARLKRVEDSIRSQEEQANIKEAQEAVFTAVEVLGDGTIKLFPEEGSNEKGKRTYYNEAVNAVSKVIDKGIKKELEARLKKVEEKLKALEDEVYVNDIDQQLNIALVEITNIDEMGTKEVTRENISKAAKAIEIARDFLVKISNPKIKKDIGVRINERADGVEKAKDELDIKDAETAIARADRAVEDFIRSIKNEDGESKETILTVTRFIENAETTISYIDHKSNTSVRKIFENSLKTIKAKLNMDTDEKNIFLAQDAINKATTEIIKTVEIMNNSESTDDAILKAKEDVRKAIVSARVAIVDVHNKVVNSILLNSINEIEGLFESENKFIEDSERIKTAERLLSIAEKSVREKSPSTLGDLTAAKAAIGVVQNKEVKNLLMKQWEDLNNGKVWGKDDISSIDQAERAVTKAEGSRLQKDIDSAKKIVYQLKEEERKKALLDRLNAIEIVGTNKPGDNSGGSGGKNPGDSKPGGSTSKGKEIVNDPLPVKDRDTSTPDPKWGDNKGLKKK